MQRRMYVTPTRRQCRGPRGDDAHEAEDSRECHTPEAPPRARVIDGLTPTPGTSPPPHAQHQLTGGVGEQSRVRGAMGFTELYATTSFIVPPLQILKSTTYPADQKHR